MSKHAKKMKRAIDWAGGTFPEIDVEEMDHGSDDEAPDYWLSWFYHLAPYELRLEICLTEEDRTPWLYVNGNDSQLDDEKTQTHAEANYGAMTRVRLLEAHAEEIRNPATREAGLARLRDAATTAGLFGKREPHRCVKTTWTTHHEMAT